jgi:hypothetical protein
LRFNAGRDQTIQGDGQWRQLSHACSSVRTRLSAGIAAFDGLIVKQREVWSRENFGVLDEIGHPELALEKVVRRRAVPIADHLIKCLLRDLHP